MAERPTAIPHDLALQDSIKVALSKPAASITNAPTQQAAKDSFISSLPFEPVSQTPSSIPAIPLPPVPKAEPKPAAKDPHFKPFGRFGMPFNTDSGFETGPTPHPQVMMAHMVDDCAQTMAYARGLTAEAIIQKDHKEQIELMHAFDQKMLESIQTAKDNTTLSYVQNALKFFTISTGIVGGAILQFSGISTGNSAAFFYGTEMMIGGAFALGSFCLEQFGYGNSTWTTLLGLGGAFASFHGGMMGFPFLADKLPAHAATIYSGALSFLRGYVDFKKMGNEAALYEIQGELTLLDKDQKMLSDLLNKHYGALNIKDFALLFQTGTDYVAQMNQITKRIIQGSLKG